MKKAFTIVRIKNIVRGNFFLNSILECCLTAAALIRANLGGGYAADGEDLIVSRLLQEEYRMPIGKMKYVDLGANHWCRESNSYYFYRRGASGVLLEANPLLCKKLRKKRKRDIIVNAAVDIQKRKNVSFYVLSLLTRSSIDEESVSRALKMGAAVREVIQVPCVCINELLEKYQICPDLLTMDIEGMDYKVLRSLDLKKYKIKVIIVEISNEIPDVPGTMEEYMRQNGYRIHAKAGSNIIYRLIETGNLGSDMNH